MPPKKWKLRVESELDLSGSGKPRRWESKENLNRFNVFDTLRMRYLLTLVQFFVIFLAVLVGIISFIFFMYGSTGLSLILFSLFFVLLFVSFFPYAIRTLQPTQR